MPKQSKLSGVRRRSKLFRNQNTTKKRKSFMKKRKPLTKKRKSISKRRKSQKGGMNAAHYEKLKQLANRILNEEPSYKGSSHIVGSMAIALHEENQGGKVVAYPNDIDIVLIEERQLGKAPNIQGMSSDNQTATKGATFIDNNDPSLTVDVIRDEAPRNIDDKIDMINGLRVLNIRELKKMYQEIVGAWESEPEEKNIAKEKVRRLDALRDTTEYIDTTQDIDTTKKDKKRGVNLFGDY